MVNVPMGEEPRGHEIHRCVQERWHCYEQDDCPLVNSICKLYLRDVAGKSDRLHSEVDNQPAEDQQNYPTIRRRLEFDTATLCLFSLIECDFGDSMACATARMKGRI